MNISYYWKNIHNPNNIHYFWKLRLLSGCGIWSTMVYAPAKFIHQLGSERLLGCRRQQINSTIRLLPLPVQLPFMLQYVSATHLNSQCPTCKSGHNYLLCSIQKIWFIFYKHISNSKHRLNLSICLIKIKLLKQNYFVHENVYYHMAEHNIPQSALIKWSYLEEVHSDVSLF